MHLVVPTHPCFFWVVSHPSRTLPLKEFEQEPQNKLSLLPTARPYPILPLTLNPPFLYWPGISQWCLGLARAPVLCTSKACPLFMHLPWFEGLSMHSTTHHLLWRGLLFDFSFPYGLLLSRVGPCLIVGFYFFSLLLCSFCGLATIPAMLLYYTCHGVI